jgi:hypothetical protein
MVQAQAHVLIARSCPEVFRFVAVDFFRNYRKWSPEVILLQPISPGPIRLGSTARQIRVDFGRRTEVTFRVSVFEQQRRIDFQGISAPIWSSYRFVEVGTRTRLTFKFELSRLELLMRPFEKTIERKVQEGVERLVWNIKRLMESEKIPGRGV